MLPPHSSEVAFGVVGSAVGLGVIATADLAQAASNQPHVASAIGAAIGGAITVMSVALPAFRHLVRVIKKDVGEPSTAVKKELSENTRITEAILEAQERVELRMKERESLQDLVKSVRHEIQEMVTQNAVDHSASRTRFNTLIEELREDFNSLGNKIREQARKIQQLEDER